MVAVEEVLEWCNMVRKDLGLPPREELMPGLPGGAYGVCPIARTIEAGADADAGTIRVIMGFSGARVRIQEGFPRFFDSTPAVQDFLVRFDAGEIPGLIAEDAEELELVQMGRTLH